MRCYEMQRIRTSEGYKYHPCGRCVACQKNDATAWGLRMYLESRYYEESIFLTLTYDDEHLPSTNSKYVSGNLVKEDVQKFIKLLRYYYGKDIKYLCAGEYGDGTFRPHYHLCITGISVDDPIFSDKFWVNSKNAYICKLKFWKNGEVCVRSLLRSDCFYTAKYSLKARGLRFKELEKEGTPLPFRLVSKGLGLQYLKDNFDRIKTDGFIRYHGFKIAIPRYYYDKIYPVGSREREWHSTYLATSGRGDRFWLPYLDKYKTIYSVNRALSKQQEINNMKGK